MTRWEYCVWEVEEPHQNDDYDTLDAYGHDGWEAFAVSTHETSRGSLIYVYHFKRPAVPPPADIIDTSRAG